MMCVLPPTVPPIQGRLQINLEETYSSRNLSASVQAERPAGPPDRTAAHSWTAPPGVPYNCYSDEAEFLFVTCLCCIISLLQCVKLKSDKGNAVLEIFISSRAS